MHDLEHRTYGVADMPPDIGATAGEVVGATDDGVWLPPAAAAVRLNISERTLWRHVNAGKLTRRTNAGRAEICISSGDAVAGADCHVSGAMSVSAPALSPDLARMLTTLDALLVANGETMERQADQLVTQAEAIGRLYSERDAALAELAAERRRGWLARLFGR